MNAWAMTASVIGLGIAGLDPVGALMAMAAIAAGARRRTVVLFFGAAAAVTILTGVVVGESVQAVTAWIGTLTVPDPLRLVVQLLVAVMLGWWAVRRWLHRGRARSGRRGAVLARPLAMGVAGVLWGVSAVTDPSFLALAAIDSQGGGLLQSIVLFAGWFVISQAPLCVVVLALSAGTDSAPVRRALAVAQRLATPTSILLTALLAVASVLLLVSASVFVIHGRFLPF